MVLIATKYFDPVHVSDPYTPILGNAKIHVLDDLAIPYSQYDEEAGKRYLVPIWVWVTFVLVGIWLVQAGEYRDRYQESIVKEILIYLISKPELHMCIASAYKLAGIDGVADMINETF